MAADPGSTRRPSSTRTRERARGRRSEQTRARHSAWTGIRTPDWTGATTYRVIVTDVVGNSTTSSTVTNRKIQNLPPFIDITSPGNYINAASPSPFTITVTTEALQFGVDHVEFFRCTDASVNCSTGTFASIGVDSTDPYTGSWAQASEPEGNRALNALVVDGDGGTGADVFNVIIDRTAPTGSITAPGSGATSAGRRSLFPRTRRTRCQASRRWSSSARRPVREPGPRSQRTPPARIRSSGTRRRSRMELSTCARSRPTWPATRSTAR